MSTIAGVFVVNRNPVPPLVDRKVAAILSKHLSRLGGPLQTHDGPGFFLAKLDVGAFPARAFLARDSGAVATLTGHPFLQTAPNCSRADDLGTIAARLEPAGAILRSCRGSFSLCYHNPATDLFMLASDHLGIRPLYYFVAQDSLYFSSSLRVLEALPGIARRPNLRAVAEITTVGFPLGDGTGYEDIRLVGAGECLVAHHGEVNKHSYFNWDEVHVSTRPVEELLQNAHSAFLDAVACRSTQTAEAVCTLSGGLDSRCVVTSLHDAGKRIYAITFHTDGYLDSRLAQLYAERLGIPALQRASPPSPAWDDWARCMSDPVWPTPEQPGNTRLIHTGDGGSVNVGFVHIDPVLFNLMRQNRVDDAAAALTKQWPHPRHALHREAYHLFRATLAEGVREELKRSCHPDLGRRLHLFYMLNDQKRHLHSFYEEIDRYRIDFLLPFFDANFLEALISMPSDVFLRHQFYHRWIEKFPPVFRDVAWQTYPGHLPCPKSPPPNLRYQFEKRRSHAFAGKNRLLFKKCRRLLFSSSFPSGLLRRSFVAVACVLHGLRVRHYQDVFNLCVESAHYLPPTSK